MAGVVRIELVLRCGSHTTTGGTKERGDERRCTCPGHSSYVSKRTIAPMKRSRFFLLCGFTLSVFIVLPQLERHRGQRFPGKEFTKDLFQQYFGGPPDLEVEATEIVGNKTIKYGQRWVIATLECPYYYNLNVDDDFMRQVDWIATYRSSSDFPMHYFHVMDRTEEEKEDGSKSIEAVNATLDSKIHVAFAFISNCQPEPRLAALEALEKHFPDIEASVVTMNPSAPGRGRGSSPLDCHPRLTPIQHLTVANEGRKVAHGKYTSLADVRYLNRKVFAKNSVCEEYVTEKLGRALDTHSIPISMANQTGVKLPPRSYLKVPVDTGEVTDEGIAELAQQMKQLMADSEEYMSYFTWRTDYKVDQRTDTFTCDLCNALNTEAPESRNWKSVADFESWHGTKTSCTIGGSSTSNPIPMKERWKLLKEKGEQNLKEKPLVIESSKPP
ncbi:unnamed protein product [Cyprideis torosa]|uniref:Fucosyltransferase n=1 Tax=Cyprideis torosa TaxID=163714 RepID=A0A7R8WB11_9CRUS|nr:unnamed protein product [Cyprideis torosa]CAG0891670.1 unnamed protein product [Cyprideis torosa]